METTGTLPKINVKEVMRVMDWLDHKAGEDGQPAWLQHIWVHGVDDVAAGIFRDSEFYRNTVAVPEGFCGTGCCVAGYVALPYMSADSLDAGNLMVTLPYKDADGQTKYPDGFVAPPPSRKGHPRTHRRGSRPPVRRQQHPRRHPPPLQRRTRGPRRSHPRLAGSGPVVRGPRGCLRACRIRPNTTTLTGGCNVQPFTLADAEAELRARLLDPWHADEEIARACVDVDALDTGKPTPSLKGSALWYASRGIPVFPLRPGTKLPFSRCTYCARDGCKDPGNCGHLLCHGCLGATTNADRVREWWGKHPTANIGIATGHTVDVVDIDGPTGNQSSAARWCEEGPDCEARKTGAPDCNHGPGHFAEIDAKCLGVVSTPRPGGLHLYVPAAGVGNKTGMLPSVDYRGKGGYVVAPPSRIKPGGKDHAGVYYWLRPLDLEEDR